LLNNTNKTRLVSLETEIEQLTECIVVPLMISKEVNDEAFNALYKCLEEIASILAGSEILPRSLLSKLFKIYTLINGEASHAKMPEKHKIILALAKLETYLTTIFDDD
jgi:hypothetical protein